jgi:magnesium chelatase family protein
MLAQLRTFALFGIDAVPVEVEVDTAPAQMPKTVLVGLPELTVRESVHRIERALVNLGYRLHYGRTVINLAPAALRKDAGAFRPANRAWHARLTRSNHFRPARRLRLGRQTGARRHGLPRGRRAFDGDVPAANAREAAVVGEVEVFGVGSLADAVAILMGVADFEPVSPPTGEVDGKLNKYDIDFAGVKGQEFAKRALTVATAGGHNVLLL